MKVTSDQLLRQVADFMDYHSPTLERQIPEAATAEYIELRAQIKAHLTTPEKAPAKPAKKKPAKKKKVTKKK